MVCFGSAISLRGFRGTAGLATHCGKRKKGDETVSCPMLGRCGKYGMCCDGRNFGECDFYRRLLKEPRKWRVGRELFLGWHVGNQKRGKNHED